MKFLKLLGVLLLAIAFQGCSKNERGADSPSPAQTPKSVPQVQPSTAAPVAPNPANQQDGHSSDSIMKIIDQSTCGVELVAQDFPENSGSSKLRMYQVKLTLSARGDYRLTTQQQFVIREPDNYQLVDHDLVDFWYRDGNEIVLKQGFSTLARLSLFTFPHVQKVWLEFEQDYMALPPMNLDVLACLQKDPGALAKIDQQKE